MVVVEGTLDAMAIAVAAIRSGRADSFCPLTQSGRELSQAQLAQVIEMHPGIPVLGFDGDRAGQDSAYRHSLAALRQGRAVVVTVLPDDHDPASWLAEHGDEGLSAWIRDGTQRGGHEAPAPVGATTFASRYVDKGIGRRERSTIPTGPIPVPLTEVIGL